MDIDGSTLVYIYTYIHTYINSEIVVRGLASFANAVVLAALAGSIWLPRSTWLALAGSIWLSRSTWFAQAGSTD